MLDLAFAGEAQYTPSNYSSLPGAKITLLQHARLALTKLFLLLRRGFNGLRMIQHRERLRLSAQMARTRELLPLLMKQRNGYRWSAAERLEIRAHLRSLLSLSPYLIVFLLPGGLLLLPVLAWWLDRRRQRRMTHV